MEPTPSGHSPAVQVVVVGAGISGLAAADAVRRARPDAEVVVLEASDRVGGKLMLGEVAGVPVDLGAESILNRRPEGVALARAHGLGDRIVHPATIEARIWSRGALRAMPRSVLGVPADLEELAASGVLSAAGLARARTEPDLPPTELPAEDVSVGWLVEQRFGEEVVDRLIEPLLGGVYAGHARELSARAAAPQVLGLLDRSGSMTAAAAASQAGRGSNNGSTPVFAGLRGGVGQLATAVAGDLDVRLGTTVRALRRTASGWELQIGPAVAPALTTGLLTADAVILAVPGQPAARLLTEVAPTAAEQVGAIEYASMAVITVAHRVQDVQDVPTLPGSGFLVPPVERRHVKAATFSFAKWDWVREAGGELVVLRASIGRHREEAALQVEDSELVARTVADLQDATGIAAQPVATHVQRWGGGLPQYAVGHLDRVARIRESVAGAPGLAVCGAAYDGLGIPACIASGHRAAGDVLAALPRRERMGS